MNTLDQLEASIDSEMQMYETDRTGNMMNELDQTEAQQYAITPGNPKDNLSRIQLLQQIKNWIGHIREEMLFGENVASDVDPLSLLESRILENMSEDDLLSAEILQKVNMWISEIRYTNF
jgi:hypothetical protein